MCFINVIQTAAIFKWWKTEMAVGAMLLLGSWVYKQTLCKISVKSMIQWQTDTISFL